jgi:hypothetical protein
MQQFHPGLLLLFAVTASTTCYGVPRIREVDFNNHTFPFASHKYNQLPRSVKVVKGLYHSPHYEPSLSYTYFKVAEVIYGDLNSDAREDAAVVTIYGGASSDYYETRVYLYGMDGRRPKLMGTLSQESCAREYEHFGKESGSSLFEALAGGTRIERGGLTVKYFAGVAHCCPSTIVTLQYRLANNQLAIVSKSLRKFDQRDVRIQHSAEDR